MTSTLPQRKSDVKLHVSETEALLVPPGGQPALRLNPTALAIWELCDGETTFSEAVTALDELTSGSEAEIAADVKQALEQFHRFGVVSPR